MATAAAIPLQEGESDNLHQGGIRLLNLRERVVFTLTACRSHNWSFPQTSKEMRVAYATHQPYNSHQQCPDCGAMRLYDTQTMEGGPLFQKDLK